MLNPQKTLCARVTDAALAALAGPALRRLELYWNLRVTDGLLQALARANTRLAVLNLSGCKQVTDAGVAAVARACPRLTHVDLTRWARSHGHCMHGHSRLRLRLTGQVTWET